MSSSHSDFMYYIFSLHADLLPGITPVDAETPAHLPAPKVRMYALMF